MRPVRKKYLKATKDRIIATKPAYRKYGRPTGDLTLHDNRVVKKALWPAVSALVLVVVYVYVFPGLWVYQTIGPSIARVNRFTATVQLATEHGWQTQEQILEQAKRDEAAGLDEKEKQLATDLEADQVINATLRSDQAILYYKNKPYQMEFGKETVARFRKVLTDHHFSFAQD